MLPVLLALLFTSTALLVYALLTLFFADRLIVARRMAEVAAGGGRAPSWREQELKEPFWRRVIRPLFGSLKRAAGLFIPVEKSAALEEKLNRAGRPGGLGAGEYALGKYLLAGLAALLGLFLAKAFPPAPLQKFLFALAGLLAGWYLPDFYLNLRIRERAEAIRRELPDVLDLLTVCVEAGLGFDGALLKVAERKEGILPKEFYHLLREINMGKPRREAIKDLAAKLGVEEFSSLAGAIVVADRLGISIGNVLRAQAEAIRRKRRQRAEEKALKAPVKMLFPLVFFIFPAVFLVLLGPAVLKISKVFLR